jgi:hypothetical protein
MLEGASFGMMLRDALGAPGKSMWLILFVTEVTCLICMEAALGRDTWLKDLILVGFGAVLSLAHWIVLFIILRFANGILPWQKRVMEKKGPEEQLLRWRLASERIVGVLN